MNHALLMMALGWQVMLAASLVESLQRKDLDNEEESTTSYHRRKKCGNRPAITINMPHIETMQNLNNILTVC